MCFQQSSGSVSIIIIMPSCGYNFPLKFDLVIVSVGGLYYDRPIKSTLVYLVLAFLRDIKIILWSLRFTSKTPLSEIESVFENKVSSVI